MLSGLEHVWHGIAERLGVGEADIEALDVSSSSGQAQVSPRCIWPIKTSDALGFSCGIFWASTAGI